MRKNKKRGSTLLVVVIFCAMLSLITLSIMMITTGGFTLRKTQNKRVENFYAADSGISIAESEIVKVIDEASKEGYKRVESIKQEPGNFPEVNIKEEGWEKLEFAKGFESYLDGNLENRIDNVNPPLGSGLTITEIYKEHERKGIEIKVDATLEARNATEKSKLEFTLNSNFKDSENKEREVVVDYHVKTPEYGKSIGTVIDNTAIFNYLMGIDGNLDITAGSSFQAIGSMWVGGKNQTGERAIDSLSYKPAIHLRRNSTHKGEFNWQGDIITPRDVYSDDVLLGARSIYADNLLVKIDNENNQGITEKNSLKGYSLKVDEKVSVYNDFIFDAKDGKAEIGNFYGLDEYDEKNVVSTEEAKTDSANWNKSSSIIVNSDDFGKSSLIEVNDYFYVMGTAYLQLEGKDYKTGESVAINKYSEPYTLRKNNNLKLSESEYLYKYHNPLHLVDKKFNTDKSEYKDLSVQDKATLVKDYFTENKHELTKNVFNGFDIKNTKNAYTAGVAYSKKDLLPSKATLKLCDATSHSHIDGFTKIDCERKSFVEQVYNMGGEVGDTNSKYYFKTRGEDLQLSVEESFNWQFIRDNLMTRQTLDDKGGNVLFNRTDSWPGNSEVKTVSVFESEKTAKEILSAYGDKIELGNLASYKMRIVFNSSERNNKGQVIGKPKSLLFDNNTLSNLEKSNDDVIRLPLKYIETVTQDTEKFVTVIISDGDIQIMQPSATGPWEIRGLFYTTENLKFEANAGMTFGNISVPEFDQLNNIFRRLFGGIIGGVVDDGIIDQGNGETVINPSECLEQKSWKLIK